MTHQRASLMDPHACFSELTKSFLNFIFQSSFYFELNIWESHSASSLKLIIKPHGISALKRSERMLVSYVRNTAKPHMLSLRRGSLDPVG